MPKRDTENGTEEKDIPPIAFTNAVKGMMSQSAAPTSPCNPVISENGVMTSKNRYINIVYGKMTMFEMMKRVWMLPKKYAASGMAVRFAATDTETDSAA